MTHTDYECGPGSFPNRDRVLIGLIESLGRWRVRSPATGLVARCAGPTTWAFTSATATLPTASATSALASASSATTTLTTAATAAASFTHCNALSLGTVAPRGAPTRRNASGGNVCNQLTNPKGMTQLTGRIATMFFA